MVELERVGQVASALRGAAAVAVARVHRLEDLHEQLLLLRVHVEYVERVLEDLHEVARRVRVRRRRVRCGR